MRAAVYTRYGPPDVLEIKEVPTPTPNADEVLIRIHATTVNRTDCGYLRANPLIIRFFSGLRRPRRPILGNEFAGKIEAVGSSVSAFQVEDRVLATTRAAPVRMPSTRSCGKRDS
jgi:NADPH:quinone reductase-like Zn-dependent oxidoreductase